MTNHRETCYQSDRLMRLIPDTVSAHLVEASMVTKRQYTRLLALKGYVLLFLISTLSGCASVPGETGEQQMQAIDELVERTLPDLYKQEPKAREEIANSIGYVIAKNTITKVPIVGVGSGYGVAINNKTGEKTYLTMSRFDIGGGWGARSVRPVLIFQDEKKFKDFIDGIWEAQAGAEAAAKVGESGAAGGAGSGNLSDDKGYLIYTITDAGVSATATMGIIRIRAVKLKE